MTTHTVIPMTHRAIGLIRGGMIALLASCVSMVTHAESTAPEGIDVSHYQGDVDWDEVEKDSVSFAFIKASQGQNTVDSKYARNREQVSKTGILYGIYHYLDPSVDAAAQAAHFADVSGGDFGHFPPVVDIEAFENETAAEVIDVLNTFVATVEQQFGCKPMIYTSHGFWNQLDDHDYGGYRLWLADYASNPELPNGWSDWQFWQYQSTGKVDGVAGEVDRSRFNGDVDALGALACGK